VNVRVGVGVIVGVSVMVGVLLDVGEKIGVGVSVGVSVGVDVAVGVGVGASNETKDVQALARNRTSEPTVSRAMEPKGLMTISAAFFASVCFP
jgi:hypothetical protein